MIFCAYAVRDMKAEAFMLPFFVPTDGLALRSFTDAANDAQTNMCKWPDDFALFHIGSYDDGTGLLEALPAPRNMGLASQFKEVKSNG